MKKLADHPTRFIELLVNVSIMLKGIFIFVIVAFGAISLLLLLSWLLWDGYIDVGHVVFNIPQILFLISLVFYVGWYNYTSTLKNRKHKNYRDYQKHFQKLIFILINGAYSILSITGVIWKILLFPELTSELIVCSTIGTAVFTIITVAEIHLFIDSKRPTWHDQFMEYADTDEFPNWEDTYKKRYKKVINRKQKQRKREGLVI